jgi:phytoene/squalene synthetase
VSEPQIGEIRLQWWRDTLASIAERKPQDHPVAEALAGAVARHQLPIKPLLDLVEAHSHDLYADRFADRHALEEYLGKTHSALIQLSAIILDREAAPGAAVAAGLAGVAYGLGQILSDPKRHANLLPLDETLGSLAELARRRLQEARTLHIPTSLRPAFHHVSLTELFLKHPGHPPSSVRQQWALWRMARTNSF